VTDNVVLSAGTADGVTLATDDVGGVHYQIVKLTYGALDSATLVSTSNGLPVAQQGTWNITNVSGTVSLPTGASTAAKQPALGTAGTASSDVISVQGIASMTPLQVADNAGSLTVDNAGTFAVQAAQSGTWNVTNVSGTVSLPTGAATAAKQPALGTAGSASTDVITIQGIASMTKLLVTPDSVALPANQSVNCAQLAGTATDTNSGNKSAGTLRVVLATDQPQLTNKLLVTPDANSAVNVAQINGVTPLMGNGVSGTGSHRVTIASDNTAFSVNSTLKPATTGGFTTATGSIAATKTDIKGSAGQVYGWYFYNPNASVAYVQFFNAAAASVTLGTTAPVYSLGIPATSGANVMSDIGIPHSTAICIAVTTTRAGSTGPGSTVDYNIYYN